MYYLIDFTYIDQILLPFIVILPVLIATAYFTLAERKILASIQRRVGPGVVGIWGVLQPLADGVKLLTKDNVVPSNANKFIWHFTPFISLWCSFAGWLIINSNINLILSSLNFGILFTLLLSSLNVYWVFLSGWFSMAQYGVLGSLRAISQLLSYELIINLIILPIVLFSGTLNYTSILYMQEISSSFFLPLWPCAIIYFICILAETNRIPFDLLEAEAELVAGYYTEFGGFWFASFFLSEYGNMLLMSGVFATLFCGKNLFFESIVSFDLIADIFFYIKLLSMIFLFIFLRANLPRYRFDQLMIIGWKVLLPLVLGLIFFYIGIFILLECSNIIQVPFIQQKYLYTLVNFSII